MDRNKFGELIFNQDDICDLLYSTGSLPATPLITECQVDNDIVETVLQNVQPTDDSLSVQEFDRLNQANWYMPDDYKELDIASHLISLCNHDDTKMQRVAHELLLYQERNLLDLLRYLKYLVDTMKKHKIIWGVGRGSSVASYVLFLLGVHKIDSIYYDLHVEEFLR